MRSFEFAKMFRFQCENQIGGDEMTINDCLNYPNCTCERYKLAIRLFEELENRENNDQELATSWS